MLAYDRLITFGGWRGIESFRLCGQRIDAQWQFAEAGFDPVIHGEVDCPRRKIAEDSRPETAVKSTQTIVQDDVAKGGCSSSDNDTRRYACAERQQPKNLEKKCFGQVQIRERGGEWNWIRTRTIQCKKMKAGFTDRICRDSPLGRVLLAAPGALS